MKKRSQFWVQCSLGREGPFTTYRAASDFAMKALRDRAIANGLWDDSPLIECDGETHALLRFVDYVQPNDLPTLPSQSETTERERAHVAEWFAEFRENVERMFDPSLRYVPLGPVYVDSLTDDVSREVYQRELERIVVMLMDMHPNMRNLAQELRNRRKPQRP